VSVQFVQGDIFLTRAQVIAVDLNADGHLGVSPLFTTLSDRYPVFVSDYHRRCRGEALAPGDIWLWRDGQPWLMGMVVRETPHSATRLRYVEAALIHLYKNWEREGLSSLAIARLAEGSDWLPARGIIEYYLSGTDLPVTVYENHIPGMAAEASDLSV
jgi:hypothetical protein